MAGADRNVAVLAEMPLNVGKSPAAVMGAELEISALGETKHHLVIDLI